MRSNSRKLSKLTFAACLSLALLAMAVFADGRLRDPASSRRAVKVTYSSVVVQADGSRASEVIHVRTLAHGQMRLQEYEKDKLVRDIYIGQDGRTYGVSHKRRTIEAANDPQLGGARYNLTAPPETGEHMMKQKQFDRTETHLGLTAYVFLIRDEQGTLQNELWRAPGFDPLNLKEISYRSDGSRRETVATKIEYDRVGEVRPEGYTVVW